MLCIAYQSGKREGIKNNLNNYAVERGSSKRGGISDGDHSFSTFEKFSEELTFLKKC